MKIFESHQEVFDAVLNHMRKQRCQSFDRNKQQCMYQSSSGNMCAIGGILPGEIDKKMLDNNPFTDSSIDSILNYHFMKSEPEAFPGQYENFMKMKNLFKNIDTEFLKDLQSVHDAENSSCRFSMINFEAEMKIIADENGLTYSSV